MAMFRNGMMMVYNENVQLATEKQLNDWLTAEDTLKIIGVIDEVNCVKVKMKIIFMIVSLGQFENAEQHHRRGG